MTKAEMDCCKKMSGDCSMGTRNHPCCKTVSTAPTPVASIQATVQFTPTIVLVALIPEIKFALQSEPDLSLIQVGLPPPAPPGTDSILRI
jgi:hypothetical protein